MSKLQKLTFGNELPSLDFDKYEVVELEENEIELNNDDLELMAPAMLKETLSNEERKELGRSRRYKFLSTNTIRDILRKEGWVLTNVMSPTSRINPDTCRHMMTFSTQNTDYLKPLDELGLVPKILIVNSHNGTVALKMHIGLYRKTCNNTLIVADEMLDGYRVRHWGNEVESINQYIKYLKQALPRIISDVKRFKQIRVSQETQMRMATQGIIYRNLRLVDGFTGEVDVKSLNNSYRPAELLKVLRGSDNYNDLFTVFNRIQENLIKGNFGHYGKKNLRPSRTRNLTEARKLVLVNKELWKMMTLVANEHK